MCDVPVKTVIRDCRGLEGLEGSQCHSPQARHGGSSTEHQTAFEKDPSLHGTTAAPRDEVTPNRKADRWLAPHSATSAPKGRGRHTATQLGAVTAHTVSTWKAFSDSPLPCPFPENRVICAVIVQAPGLFPLKCPQPGTHGCDLAQGLGFYQQWSKQAGVAYKVRLRKS